MSVRDKYSMTPEEMRAHEATFGNFNDFPPGWKEVSQAEACKTKFFQCNPTLIEYRQMFTRDAEGIPRGQSIHATLYHFGDGTGVALAGDYWKGKVSWFTFAACAHEYVEQDTSRGCLHDYRCEKCGHTYTTDSSD